MLDGLAAARGVLDTDGSTSWELATLAGTGGGTFGDSLVVRFESDQRVAIAKLVRRNDVESDHPLWWRREVDVYQSQWLRDRLPTGMGLPDCVGSTTTDEAAVIVLSEVSFAREGRTARWYGELADRLARMNGLSIAPASAPTWVTRRFVAYETDQACTGIADTLANRSSRIATVIDLWRPLLERIAATGTQLVDALHSFPVGLHHLDAFSRNAARSGDHFLLIDWAYAGLAPLGCDAASLIAVTAMHSDTPTARLDEFHDVVVDAYRAGLRSVDAAVSADELQAAIDIALTLRFARFLTQIHGAGDRLEPSVTAMTGRTLDASMTSWMSLARHLEPHARQALANIRG